MKSSFTRSCYSPSSITFGGVMRYVRRDATRRDSMDDL